MQFVLFSKSLKVAQSHQVTNRWQTLTFWSTTSINSTRNYFGKPTDNSMRSGKKTTHFFTSFDSSRRVFEQSKEKETFKGKAACSNRLTFPPRHALIPRSSIKRSTFLCGWTKVEMKSWRLLSALVDGRSQLTATVIQHTIEQLCKPVSNMFNSSSAHCLII